MKKTPRRSTLLQQLPTGDMFIANKIMTYQQSSTANQSAATTSEKIAELNDQVRQSILLPPNQRTSVPHRIVMTRGVSSLPLQNQLAIAAQVSKYDSFTEGNDPYGERDFGSFEHQGKTIFWKICYYDSNLEFGSSEPEDVTKTVRVLTIMLSSEY